MRIEAICIKNAIDFCEIMFNKLLYSEQFLKFIAIWNQEYGVWVVYEKTVLPHT